jgi:uncharacterized membrane protein YhaH (DUF805 family)
MPKSVLQKKLASFNMDFAFLAICTDDLVGTNGLFYLLYGLAVFVPGLVAGARRLHDVGKSGWMLLIALIPMIGSIWLIVLMATDSNVGGNEYGQNPKEVLV